MGFGGSRTGYAYLARAWADRGWGVAVVEHVGSNLEVLRSLKRPGLRGTEWEALVRQTARDPREAEQRLHDLGLVYRALKLAGAVGLAGHSLGASTVLEAATREGAWPCMGLLAISPPGPGAEAYRRLAAPVLLLTGTRDDFGCPSQERQKALFALAPTSFGALAVLEGADHMVFAGVGLNIKPYLERIVAVTLAFWEQVQQGCPLTDPRVEGAAWQGRTGDG